LITSFYNNSEAVRVLWMDPAVKEYTAEVRHGRAAGGSQVTPSQGKCNGVSL